MKKRLIRIVVSLAVVFSYFCISSVAYNLGSMDGAVRSCNVTLKHAGIEGECLFDNDGVLKYMTFGGRIKELTKAKPTI